MPELPEVETIRRALCVALEGRRLVAVETRRPDLRFALPGQFAERLNGRRIETVGRRGKYLVVGLEGPESLIWHLGMSGRVTIDAAEGEAPATPGAFTLARRPNPVHDHVIFSVDSGARVTFNDPRRFGFMDLAPSADLDAWKAFATMGPEPLSQAFSGRTLSARLKQRKAGIWSLLLDQRTVAGLGNIYVCEALFRARIAPGRPGGRVRSSEADALVRAIRQTLDEAVEAGGSSLRDYAHADGGLGYFQLSHDVYGREGKPCRRPGCNGRIVRERRGGRSAFACEACQN